MTAFDNLRRHSAGFPRNPRGNGAKLGPEASRIIAGRSQRRVFRRHVSRWAPRCRERSGFRMAKDDVIATDQPHPRNVKA
jgi:hypothetical protein